LIQWLRCCFPMPSRAERGKNPCSIHGRSKRSTVPHSTFFCSSRRSSISISALGGARATRSSLLLEDESGRVPIDHKIESRKSKIEPHRKSKIEKKKKKKKKKKPSTSHRPSPPPPPLPQTLVLILFRKKRGKRTKWLLHPHRLHLGNFRFFKAD
jgi:hypothetical protein